MRINIVQIIIPALICGLNAKTAPERREKAKEIVRIYSQDGIDEVDPEEVIQLLDEFTKDFDEQEISKVGSQESGQPAEEVIEQLSDSIDDFEYALSNPVQNKLHNACQSLMSESSKDLPSAYECATKLLMLSKFANKKQVKLDSMYHLVLLFFNLHHQNEEFMNAYLAMCVKIFIEYYNSATDKNGNKTKIAKAMIRAIYAANKIGETRTAQTLKRIYNEEYKSYSASNFEKNLLKNV